MPADANRVVRAVVFDMDGILMDSEPIWERVRRDYVIEHGGDWRDEAQLALMGMSTAEWSAYLHDELGVDRPPEQIAQEVIADMAQRYETDGLPILPGADEAVGRTANRWPLGLASSSPRQLIDRALEVAGWTDLFQASWSTEQVPRGKPAPDVYLSVLSDLGVAPADAVAIEDSSNGVRSAAAAGLRVIAVPRPEYPLAADAKAAASTMLRSLDEVTPELLTG
jgi:HAD superfamily hydrolase (TIGR01509 family)